MTSVVGSVATVIPYVCGSCGFVGSLVALLPDPGVLVWSTSQRA